MITTTSFVTILASVAMMMPQTYTSPGLPPPTQTRTPYLGSTSRSGPPLSTALPTSGPFSRGMTTSVAASTGVRTMPSRSMSPSFGSPPMSSYRNNLNSFHNPEPIVSGRSMANVYMQRALYSGVPF